MCVLASVSACECACEHPHCECGQSATNSRDPPQRVGRGGHPAGPQQGSPLRPGQGWGSCPTACAGLAISLLLPLWHPNPSGSLNFLVCEMVTIGICPQAGTTCGGLVGQHVHGEALCC